MLKDFLKYCHDHRTFAHGLIVMAIGTGVGITGEAGRIPGGLVLLTGIAFALYGLIDSPNQPNSSQK